MALIASEEDNDASPRDHLASGLGASAGWEQRRASRGAEPAAWAGTAFLVEALVLLAFLAASLGVLATVFAESQDRALEAQRLETAVVLAQDAAESFAANPASVPQQRTVEADGASYQVLCSTQPDQSGASYEAARIQVSCDGEEVFALDTGRALAPSSAVAEGASVVDGAGGSATDSVDSAAAPVQGGGSRG